MILDYCQGLKLAYQEALDEPPNEHSFWNGGFRQVSVDTYSKDDCGAACSKPTSTERESDPIEGPEAGCSTDGAHREDHRSAHIVQPTKRPHEGSVDDKDDNEYRENNGSKGSSTSSQAVQQQCGPVVTA